MVRHTLSSLRSRSWSSSSLVSMSQTFRRSMWTQNHQTAPFQSVMLQNISLHSPPGSKTQPTGCCFASGFTPQSRLASDSFIDQSTRHIQAFPCLSTPIVGLPCVYGLSNVSARPELAGSNHCQLHPGPCWPEAKDPCLRAQSYIECRS